MRTARCSGRFRGGEGCLPGGEGCLPMGDVCPGGVYLPVSTWGSGGLSAWGGVFLTQTCENITFMQLLL